MSAWKFGVLRFSRLYPLHFVTLLFVAAGQWFYKSMMGSFFGDLLNNDPYHFVLQAVFRLKLGL